MASRRPFASLLLDDSKAVRGGVERIPSPFTGRTTERKRRGDFVTDPSGFTFFNSAANRHNTRTARKLGFVPKKVKTSTGRQVLHSINGILVNPRSFLKERVQPKENTSFNPFSGQTSRKTRVTQSDADTLNAPIDQFNSQFDSLIRDFDEQRLKFAQRANKARVGNTKDPAALNKSARQEQTNISAISNKSVNPRARKSRRGSRQGVGLGTGGSGLGI